MRQGQNPAKSIEYVAQPRKVTVAVVTYIPFLSGYYAQSLDILKVCLRSILAYTNLPFDLLVFDNASCVEVTDYLTQLKDQGQIQYLLLSDTNIGKVGAWNMIFGAAPGEMVAYSDSDVVYYPNWLTKHLEVFEAFPEAGTVAGLPRRGRRTFYTNTIELFENLPNVIFEKGKFIPDEWILDHARSLGKLDEIHNDLAKMDYRITRAGVKAYATATHFQFMVRAEIIRKYLPFPSDRPMGDSVAHFDRAINDNNLLRLATTDRLVQHIGNTLDGFLTNSLPSYLFEDVDLRSTRSQRITERRNSAWFSDFKPVKWILHRIYNWIFELYYR